MSVGPILELYARGLFPMDEPGAPRLPWWTADPRTIFELDDGARGRTHRAVRRSLKTGESWDLLVNCAFDEVLRACASPRHENDGVWMTPRLCNVYRRLRSAGHCHSIEIWAKDALAAGAICVTLGRAAMLESMFHRYPHSGNVLISRALDLLHERGFSLCDVQLSSPHLLRLGAVEVPQADYVARLRAATGITVTS